MRRAMVALLVVLGVAIPAGAQRYGQWWVSGKVAAEGQRYDNDLGGKRVSRYIQRRLRLDLALNGFILDPAIARFRLELDAAFDRYKDGLGLDSDTTGGRLDLHLLPRSLHPVRLYASHRRYRYTGSFEEASGSFLPGIPDTLTTWGGRLRLRHGPLRGTLLAIDRSTLSLVGHRSQRDNREVVDWGPPGGRLQHHYRLEHRVQEYAAFSYRTDDWTFNGDEHGEVGRGWRWDMTAIGTRRSFEVPGVRPTDSDVLRLANRFNRETAGKGLLTIAYELGYAGTGPSSRTSHLVDGRWERDLGHGWRVGPFGSFAYDSGDSGSASSQRLGALATWTGTVGPFSGVFSGQVAAGRTGTRTDGRPSLSMSFTSVSVATTLGHGSEERLREELELEWTTEDLSQSGTIEPDLPDLGASLAVAGNEDRKRARVTLRRRFRRLEAWMYSEWRRREADDVLSRRRFVTTGTTHSLQLNWRSLAVGVNVNGLEVRRLARQHVDSSSVSVSWRPWRPLSLQASYRSDTRRLELVPDVKGEQLQGAVELSLGVLDLRGEYFESRETVVGGTRRRNRGLFWSVSRRFGAALPIVTAPRRRGIIR